MSIKESFDRCLEICDDPYFTILSDDDYYHSDFIKEIRSLFNRHSKTSVLAIRHLRVDSNGELIIVGSMGPEQFKFC